MTREKLRALTAGRLVVVGLLVMPLLLSGCAEGDREAPLSAPSPAEPIAEQQPILEVATSGQEAYIEHCAACHDDGADGAPRIGQAEDWSDRSELVSAVLAGHVQAGYLEMPAQGGTGGLAEDAIGYAIDFMMLRTFPERSPD